MDKANEDNNVTTFTNFKVKEVLVGEKKSLEGILMINTKTGEESTIRPDGVFLFIGLTPNSKPVRKLVDFSKGGFIISKTNMMTKTPGLFVAGDCREGSTKQAVSAMGEGAATAIHIRDYLRLH